MFKIPTTFDEKLDIAISYAKREVRINGDKLFSELACARAERDLEFALENQFPMQYIDNAQQRLNDANIRHYGYEMREELFGDDVPGPTCWTSGYEYDDYGLEKWASVTFNPISLLFVAILHTETGTTEVGSAKTFDEAEHIANRVLHGSDEDDIATGSPTITLEESNASGEIFLLYQDEQISVKNLVARVVASAYPGCGQHYSIFSNRAASSLTALVCNFEGAERECIEKYLQFSRY